MLCNYFNFLAKQEASIALCLGEGTPEPDFLGANSGLPLISCVTLGKLSLTSQCLIFLICKMG